MSARSYDQLLRFVIRSLIDEEEMKRLPKLDERFDWCCTQGCGPCEPVEKEVVYGETWTKSGALIGRDTDTEWLSNCCDAEIYPADENDEQPATWGSWLSYNT